MSLSDRPKNTATLPRVTLGSDATLEVCKTAMASLVWHPLLHSNWEPKPDDVDVTFSIAAGPGAFFLHFEVKEPVIRATFTDDNSPVCQDSCVEWFVSDGKGEYMNFEFNPIGAITVEKGQTRVGRRHFFKEDLPGLKVWTSEGDKPFGDRACDQPWHIWSVIPYDLIGLTLSDIERDGVRSNFYKCGDGLPDSHYLSWAPITTKSPDFHRPEFFAEMRLA